MAGRQECIGDADSSARRAVEHVASGRDARRSTGNHSRFEGGLPGVPARTTFSAPGVVSGRPLRRGVFTNMDTLHLAGPSFEEASARFPGAEFVGAHANFSPEDFARTIGKIAFCGAVYALGPVPFSNSPIKGVVLGTDPHIGHWVGCWEGEEVNPPKGLHALQIRCSGSDIHVILRLFAQFGAPEYHVVLGPADPAFVASPQWPWK